MFGKKNADMKAQSAMEYLMTYGWAILIIAVVLAALFELGVFNGSNLAPQACIAQAGFVCKNPVYTANGIGITFGQTAGRDYYGDWIFVASQGEALNQNGIPINFTCTATGCANAVSVGVLVPGQIVGADFNASKFAYGQIPANAPIGTPFAGYVWLGYCFSPCSAPTAYSKVATITAKEAGTSSASFGGYFGGGSGSAVAPPPGPQVGNVVFTADPLPTGTTWSVTYNGVMESNTIPSNIVFTGIPTSASLPYTVNSPLVGSSACYSTSDASGTTGVGIVSIPFSQVPCYVNITLDSTGGSAPTGFQQMLQFNPSSYTSYEASDLGNLRFYQGNSELYSWCESGCTSGSTSAIFWVKTNGLSSGTNANAITMDFEPLSGTMAQYSGPSGHAGEAPQLSCSSPGLGCTPYATYDNGAQIFGFYDNFAGSILSNSWTNSGGIQSITQDNGLTINWGEQYFSNAWFSTTTDLVSVSPGETVDWYGTPTPDAGHSYGGACPPYNTNNGGYPLGVGNDGGGVNPLIGLSTECGNPTYDLILTESNTQLITSSGWSQIDAVWTAGFYGSTTVYSEINYSSEATLTGTPTRSAYNIGWGYGYSNMLGTDTIQWVRTRVSPPNGQMPHANFGAVQ